MIKKISKMKRIFPDEYYEKLSSEPAKKKSRRTVQQIAKIIKEKCPEEFEYLNLNIHKMKPHEHIKIWEQFYEKCPEEMNFLGDRAFRRQGFDDDLIELYEHYCPKELNYLKEIHTTLSDEEYFAELRKMNEKAPHALIVWLAMRHFIGYFVYSGSDSYDEQNPDNAHEQPFTIG